MKVGTKIRHPEWLAVSNPGTSIDLYRRGLLPDRIAARMIVTGLKHPLRAVYGSDLRAALALLWQATFGMCRDEFQYNLWRMTHPKEVREMDAEIKEDLKKLREEK